MEIILLNENQITKVSLREVFLAINIRYVCITKSCPCGESSIGFHPSNCQDRERKEHAVSGRIRRHRHSRAEHALEGIPVFQNACRLTQQFFLKTVQISTNTEHKDTERFPFTEAKYLPMTKNGSSKVHHSLILDCSMDIKMMLSDTDM